MLFRSIGAIASGFLVVLGFLAPLSAQAPAQRQQPEFVKQAQQLMKEGKPEAALTSHPDVILLRSLRVRSGIPAWVGRRWPVTCEEQVQSLIQRTVLRGTGCGTGLQFLPPAFNDLHAAHVFQVVVKSYRFCPG